jgi:hypothetical protein
MDLISILTTVILATTIGTVIVGVAAYYAFKLRDKRKPKAKAVAKTGEEHSAPENVFLKLYVPPRPASLEPMASSEPKPL